MVACLRDGLPLKVSALLVPLVNGLVHENFLAVGGRDAVALLCVVRYPRAYVARSFSQMVLRLLHAFYLFKVDEFDLFCLFVQDVSQVLLAHLLACFALVSIVDFLVDRSTVEGVQVGVIAVCGQRLELRDLVASGQGMVVSTARFSEVDLVLDV